MLSNAIQGAGWEVFSRVGDGHPTRFGGVLELVVTPFDRDQIPTIVLNHFDGFLAGHQPSVLCCCGYYNYKSLFGFADKSRRQAVLTEGFKRIEADILRAGDYDFSEA